MRPPAALPLLLLSIAGAGCASRPAMQQPRPLSAPVTSTRHLIEVWLGPTAMARDLQDMRKGATAVVAGEFDLGTAKARLQYLMREPLRVRTLARDSKNLVATEVGRVGRLRHESALSVFDPGRSAAKLASAVRRLPATLQLDRRPLGEPDDLQHRTDLGDDRPEAGWLGRILRRILP